MQQIKRYLACSPLERRLFRQAVAMHLAMRIGLALLPFRTLARLVTRAARLPVGRQPGDAALLGTIVWAVTTARRHGPARGACLQEALVAQIMLSRHGFPAQFRIGVRKSDQGELEAHAWVESQGKVVIGGPRSEVETYSALRDTERITPGT